jgi:drug/metabolite transporter (DMT)-like permease
VELAGVFTDMNSPRTDPPLWKLTLAFASVYLIWGSTYLAIRFTIETVPPFSMAAIRFLFAGVILYAIARRGAPRPTRRDWSSALIVGTLLIGGGNGGVVWAIQWLPSGLAAVIIATVPLWMVLIDWVTGGSERPSLSLMLGLLWGLLGVALLVGSDQVGAQNREGLLGAAALLGASLSWATGSIYARRAKLPESPWMTTAMHMLAGGVILTVMAIVAGEPEQIDIGNISAKSAVSLFYLTIFGALVGYSAYIWLLGVTTPARASTYAYVNPAVAVFLGWLFADELIGLRSGVAIAMILSAVVVVTLKGGRPNRAIQPASASSQRE